MGVNRRQGEIEEAGLFRRVVLSLGMASRVTTPATSEAGGKDGEVSLVG